MELNSSIKCILVLAWTDGHWKPLRGNGGRPFIKLIDSKMTKRAQGNTTLDGLFPMLCVPLRGNQVTGNEMRNTEGRNGLSHTSDGGPGSPTMCELAPLTLVESVVVTGG